MQIKALTLLSPEMLGPAIKPTVVSRTVALCLYCQLRNGQIYGDGQGGQFCQCVDCGPIALTADDRAAVMRLRSRLRVALEIESRDGITDIADSVLRLGDARREPVMLAVRADRILITRADRTLTKGGGACPRAGPATVNPESKRPPRDWPAGFARAP